MSKINTKKKATGGKNLKHLFNNALEELTTRLEVFKTAIRQQNTNLVITGFHELLTHHSEHQEAMTALKGFLEQLPERFSPEEVFKVIAGTETLEQDFPLPVREGVVSTYLGAIEMLLQSEDPFKATKAEKKCMDFKTKIGGNSKFNKFKPDLGKIYLILAQTFSEKGDLRHALSVIDKSSDFLSEHEGPKEALYLQILEALLSRGEKNDLSLAERYLCNISAATKDENHRRKAAELYLDLAAAFISSDETKSFKLQEAGNYLTHIVNFSKGLSGKLHREDDIIKQAMILKLSLAAAFLARGNKGDPQTARNLQQEVKKYSELYRDCLADELELYNTEVATYTIALQSLLPMPTTKELA